MNVIDWLLDSDPAIRWQVMRDLTDAPADEVAAERARVAREGWGAQLLALQRPDGSWGGGANFPEWTGTKPTLVLLRSFGPDPSDPEVRRAVDLVRQHVRWEYDELPFFDGEVEPCINGATVAIGDYFGQDVQGIVDRLLTEQMADGGWNCEQENGSTRGSFDTTINVLEGLLEHERATGATAETTAARQRGEAYLLDRRPAPSAVDRRSHRAGISAVLLPAALALRRPARARLLAGCRRRGRRPDDRGARPGRGQARAGRPLADGVRVPGRACTSRSRGRRPAEPMEHAARAAGAALGGQGGAVDGRERRFGMTDAITIVPANEATWEDLQAVFGTRGYTSTASASASSSASSRTARWTPRNWPGGCASHPAPTTRSRR